MASMRSESGNFANHDLSTVGGGLPVVGRIGRIFSENGQ